MENYEIIWKQALPLLENSISATNYKLFIEKLTPIDIVDTTIVLMIKSETQGTLIKSKLLDKIKSVIISLNYGVTDVKIFIGSSKEEYSVTNQEKTTLPKIESSPINPKYVFDNYVVGHSNNMAFNAALEVADNPGEQFNPLFIYGASGLGKTHLLHAIANEIRVRTPSLNVLYSPSEKFLNEFISSIHPGKSGSQDNSSFREKYRNVDVLMIDDIQNLSNKPGTQEAFFNIFNELHTNNKQIILSADCDISEIQVLSDRLRTRFEWGLKVQITPPDLETKIAILIKKGADEKVIIGTDVAEFIAEISSDNVRSLEGCLKKLIFAAKLSESPITLDLAKDIFQGYQPVKQTYQPYNNGTGNTSFISSKNTVQIPVRNSVQDEDSRLTPDKIINCVCSYFNVLRTDLVAKKRTKDIVDPRHICFYLMSELLSIPQESIGQSLGRDHATVIHSRDKVISMMKESTKISHQVSELKNIILENNQGL